MDIFELLSDIKKLVEAAKAKDFATVLDTLANLLKVVAQLIGKPKMTATGDDKVGKLFDGSIRKALREALENRLFKSLAEAGLSKDEAVAKLGDGTLIEWLIQHAPQMLELIKLILTLLAVFA